MTINGAEETLTGARVSRTFFSAMGEHALIGRFFVDEEYRQDSTQVVILTHMLWKDRFGARPDIIGQTVQLDGRPATVIAVTQPNFSAPERAMFLLPRPAP
jgi:hypothetical protein